MNKFVHGRGLGSPTPIGVDWAWACQEKEIAGGWPASLPQSDPIRAELTGGRHAPRPNGVGGANQGPAAWARDYR